MALRRVVRGRGRSRGEDLITDRFPEIEALGRALPDGYVIDGEILAWAPGAAVPLPFAQLQPRITRKTLTKKVLADYPATFVAYDLLEAQGEDLRTTPLEVRRARLEKLGSPGMPGEPAAYARVRNRLRGHSGERAAQVGRGRALSAHAALAYGQKH